MSDYKIAARYAKSLIELSIEKSALAAVKNDMDTLQMASKNRDFAMMLRSPIITANKKIDTINALFGSEFNIITTNFIKLVVSNSRENVLETIGTAFIDQYNALKSLTNVVVKTATAADETMLLLIKQKFPSPELVTVTNTVDEKLIGGFVLQFGDSQIDTSVAKKLSQLKQQFA